MTCDASKLQKYGPRLRSGEDDYADRSKGWKPMISNSLARRVVLGSAVLLLFSCLLIQTWHPVSAHFNTLAPDTDVKLQWPLSGSYSLGISLKILQSPESGASIFWGYQFAFMNGETGFVGLGIGGTPKVATVGIFDANNATTSNPTGACESGISFLKSGNGYQCFIFYDWNLTANYRLQITRVQDSGGGEQWQGSIQDSQNATTIIGNVIVPSTYQQLGTNASTWDEYSTAGSCNTTVTKVVFSYPYAMNAAGNHAPAEAQVTYGSTNCQDSNVQYLGGGAYEADAGSGVTRSTPAQALLWTQEPTLVSPSQVSVAEFPSVAPAISLLLLSSIAIVARIHQPRR